MANYPPRFDPISINYINIQLGLSGTGSGGTMSMSSLRDLPNRPSGAISLGDYHQFTFSITGSTGLQSQRNLYNEAVAAGYDGQRIVKININGLHYNSNNQYEETFLISGFPGSVFLNFNAQTYILGRGGNGDSGSAVGSPYFSGVPAIRFSGHKLYLLKSTTDTVFIGGGGGGGGGNWGIGDYYVGGGGGAGGGNGGNAGHGNAPVNPAPGGAGATTWGGIGATGQDVKNGFIQDNGGGAGGGGGWSERDDGTDDMGAGGGGGMNPFSSNKLTLQIGGSDWPTNGGFGGGNIGSFTFSAGGKGNERSPGFNNQTSTTDKNGTVIWNTTGIGLGGGGGGGFGKSGGNGQDFDPYNQHSFYSGSPGGPAIRNLSGSVIDLSGGGIILAGGIGV